MMQPLTHRHRVALLDSRPSGTLLIHEIYKSLQGESTFAGLPCVFVRTAVCHLRCKWCDTPHAFNQGTPLTVPQILDTVYAYECPLVELTGGEPLLQAEVLPLMTALCEAGKTVLLETSGACDIRPVDPRVHIIMDLKCPDSGESQANYWPNLEYLKATDQIKFVIASRGDFDWACHQIRTKQLDQRHQLLLSAAFGHVPLADLARWLLESGLNVRMQLQMHKFIWAPDARGV